MGYPAIFFLGILSGRLWAEFFPAFPYPSIGLIVVGIAGMASFRSKALLKGFFTLSLGMAAALYFWSLQEPLPKGGFWGEVSFVKGKVVEIQSVYGKGRIGSGKENSAKFLKPGDILRVEGSWQRPRKTLYNLSRGLDFEGKVSKLEIYAAKGQGLALKSRAERYLSEGDWGALHRALLLGSREGLPGKIQELFRKSGTAHLLAVSGLHFGIVLYFIILGVGFIPLPGRWRVPLWLFGALGYALLLSNAPSALRALVLVWALGAARFFRRRVKILDMLWNTGGICFLLWPSLLFQIGFALSFLATALIIWSIPYWESITRGMAGWIRKGILALGIGITAQVALLGLLFYFFKEVNFLGVFMTLPLSFLLFLELGWLLLGLGLETLVPGAGQIFLNAADMAASGILGILSWTGNFQGLAIQGEWGAAGLMAFYVFLALGIFICERKWGRAKGLLPA